MKLYQIKEPLLVWVPRGHSLEATFMGYRYWVKQYAETVECGNYQYDMKRQKLKTFDEAKAACEAHALQQLTGEGGPLVEVDAIPLVYRCYYDDCHEDNNFWNTPDKSEKCPYCRSKTIIDTDPVPHPEPPTTGGDDA